MTTVVTFGPAIVDTYDTLDGDRAAIDTIRELGLTRLLAVRLDSGDLPTLARRTRALLDEAGLAHVQIFASGGLDEYDLGAVPHDAVDLHEPVPSPVHISPYLHDLMARVSRKVAPSAVPGV